MVAASEFPERFDIATEALSWPERARAAVITDTETYQFAAELLKGIKALRQKIADTFDPHVKRAHEAHRALVKEKADAEAPLTQAERVIKDALRAYDDEQVRLAEDAQRQADAEARAAEETRRLEQAALLEREGHAFGDESLVHEAYALIEAPIEPLPVAPVTKATPKVSGISYVTRYSARVHDLTALVRYVAAHPEHINLVTPNVPALNGLARSLKTGLKLPGVQLVPTKDVAAATR